MLGKAKHAAVAQRIFFEVCCPSKIHRVLPFWMFFELVVLIKGDEGEKRWMEGSGRQY